MRVTKQLSLLLRTSTLWIHMVLVLSAIHQKHLVRINATNTGVALVHLALAILALMLVRLVFRLILNVQLQFALDVFGPAEIPLPVQLAFLLFVL